MTPLFLFLDWLGYIFSFDFRKNKKVAITKLRTIIEDHNSDVKWHSTLYKALQLIKSLSSAWELHEIDSIIKDEIKQILKEAKSEASYFNPETNWFVWSNVILAINHSNASERRKDELANLVVVLNTITKEFDLSR